ncbi:MAG: amidohydrolase family protein [Gemmatimonadales bacterium]
MFRRVLLTGLLPLAGGVLRSAPDPARWLVDNHGRVAGELTAVRTGDSVVVRFIYTDRNRGARVETRYRLGPNGQPVGGSLARIGPDGVAGRPTEAFRIAGDSVHFEVENGVRTAASAARVEAGAWVGFSTGGTPWEEAALARHLLAAPGLAAPVAPSGRASAEVIADSTFTTGGRAVRARLVMVRRPQSPVASGVWLDERGELLATDIQWFITVRPDAVALLPAFRAVELRWRAREAEAAAQRVRSPVSGDLVIQGGDVFDALAGKLLARQTVVVRGDRIVEIGPADRVRAPAGATLIDAAGKTVMPGMWDMHTHLQVTNQGTGSLVQLAQGLTAVRDLASDLDVAVSQRDRERAGQLASPRVILGGFIEGPLRWAGPSASLASDEAEALALVARYDSLGYRQIKLYNLVHPDLVPVIAAEAKRRGLKLSGHIPRGMSVRAAVTLGYDEIQHAAFLFSDFYPDSLYLPSMRAYSAVATAVAPHIDVDGKPMTALIEFLARHHTVIDGTFNLWIGGGASIVGAGGSTDQQRADAAYLRLIQRLYAAGVPLLAGTDNSFGTTFRRELEMYEQAGIPREKVLQIATIEAARFLGEEGDYGSITAGKVADLIVVAGKPLERIADLAKVETVVRGGRLYRVADLTRETRGDRR